MILSDQELEDTLLSDCKKVYNTLEEIKAKLESIKLVFKESTITVEERYFLFFTKLRTYPMVLNSFNEWFCYYVNKRGKTCYFNEKQYKKLKEGNKELTDRLDVLVSIKNFIESYKENIDNIVKAIELNKVYQEKCIPLEKSIDKDDIEKLYLTTKMINDRY